MANKFKNPNTPKMWDKVLFQQNKELLESPFYNDKLNIVFNFLKNTKGKFLDVGFGMANLEKKIISGNLDLELYGIDFSSKAINNAKKSMNGVFKVGNIFKIPFKSEFFDSVAILDVLEHIEEDKILKALNEVNRVLRNNGKLVISVPINENLKKLNKEGKNFNAHLREYTLPIIKRELAKSGFNITSYEYLFAFRRYYLLKSLLMKISWFSKKPNLLIVYCYKR